MDPRKIMRRTEGKILLIVHQRTVGTRETYVSHTGISAELDLPEEDTIDYLRRLEDWGLVRDSGRLSGGWRITIDGKDVVEEFEASRRTGAERHDHVMRTVLQHLADRGQHVTLTEMMAWELHELDTPPVSQVELESYLDALEEKGLITSIHAAQGRHIRTELTPKGRMALGRPDLRLAESAPGPSSVVNQNIGINNSGTFNNTGGQVQTGDNSSQQLTNMRDQRQQIAVQINNVEDVLASADIDAQVKAAVADIVEEIKKENASPSPRPSTLRELVRRALESAVGAAGSQGVSALLGALARIPELLT